MGRRRSHTLSLQKVPLYPFRGGLCVNLVDDDINGDDVDDDHVDDDGDKNRDDNVVGW